jgi:hypothetical protein
MCSAEGIVNVITNTWMNSSDEVNKCVYPLLGHEAIIDQNLKLYTEWETCNIKVSIFTVITQTNKIYIYINCFICCKVIL